MIDITPYTGQILSAIYGEEVRGSIVDALLTMNRGINSEMTELATKQSEVLKQTELAQTAATQAVQSATNAGQYATNASASATAAQNAASAARNEVDNAKAEVDNAKGYADTAKAEADRAEKAVQDAANQVQNAKAYAEAAEEHVGEANGAVARAEAAVARAGEIADQTKQYIDDLMEFISPENLTYIYQYVRDKIVEVEGVEGPTVLNDSFGGEILDSKGEIIFASRILDPLVFEDQYRYITDRANLVSETE